MYASLAHVRPLSFGETLDGAFTLYRRHLGIFYTTALLPQLPVAALWLAYLLLMLLAQPSQETQTLLFGAWSMLNLPLALVAGILPWAALTRLAGDAYLGNEVSRANGFRWGWKRFGPVFLASLLFGIALGLGLILLVVPGFIVLAMFFAVIPVVVLEQRGVSAAVDRSRALAQGAWGRILGVSAVLYLIGVLPTLGLQLLVKLMLQSVAPGITDPLVWPAVASVMGVFFGSLTTPLTVTGLTLLYFDRRVRVEAFGLDPEGTPPMAFA